MFYSFMSCICIYIYDLINLSMVKSYFILFIISNTLLLVDNVDRMFNTPLQSTRLLFSVSSVMFNVKCVAFDS